MSSLNMSESVVQSPTSGASEHAPAPAEAVEREPFELVIEPRKGWIGVNWAEMAHYRELLYFLTWRDVKVRYKQTVLGVAWAILVPVFQMVIFTAIFGNFAGIKDKLPEALKDHYSLFVYAGLLPWTFFATGIGSGGLSLVNQQHLLTKIYFPRMFVPAATVGGALVDFAISFGVFACLMAWNVYAPSWQIVFLPLFFALMILAAMGVSLALSALTVSYRDFRFLIPFMVQAWMFLSPVIYPNSMMQKWHWLMALNPMTGIIEGYRSCIFGDVLEWNVADIAISTVTTLLLFTFGLFYFRKTERRFADVA